MSKKFSLNKTDLIAIAKVLGYAGASAMVTSALLVFQEIDIPAQYATFAVIINVVLVATKKYLEGPSH